MTGPEAFCCFQDNSAGRGESNQCDAKGIFDVPHTNCDQNECTSDWVIRCLVQWCIPVDTCLLIWNPHLHIQNLVHRPHLKKEERKEEVMQVPFDPDNII